MTQFNRAPYPLNALSTTAWRITLDLRARILRLSGAHTTLVPSAASGCQVRFLRYLLLRLDWCQRTLRNLRQCQLQLLRRDGPFLPLRLHWVMTAIQAPMRRHLRHSIGLAGPCVRSTVPCRATSMFICMAENMN